MLNIKNKIIESKNKLSLILFDLDKTLLSGNSSTLWYLFLEQKGFLTKKDKLRRQYLDSCYNKGVINSVDFYECEISILNGINYSILHTLRNEFFHSVIKYRILKKGLDLINFYKTQTKTNIVLITGCISFLAEPISYFLGIEHLICTNSIYIATSSLWSIYGEMCLNEGKITCLNEWLIKKNISSSNITFYTDSITDLSLLLKVDTQVIVHPDKLLTKEAKKRNWKIISLM
jgi:phosphoserine phosphatase